MKKTLIIDGGLGRVITAIPALEDFVKANSDTTIITHGWTQIFWGNKILADCVFDSQTKGLYQRIKDTKIVKPEPYYNTNFLNERINMAQAFYEEINGGNGEGLQLIPKLYFTKSELMNASKVIDAFRKTIIFQPFGSNAKYENGRIIDDTNRSLSLDVAGAILIELRRAGHQVILMDSKGAFNNTQYENLDNMEYRNCAAVIASAEYFIGVDSSGQHIARATNRPGTVIFGGTSAINFCYPTWFKIVQKHSPTAYVPFRTCEFDYWLANIQNNDMMDYSHGEIRKMCEDIVEDINELD
jgi:hypothetical protein